MKAGEAECAAERGSKTGLTGESAGGFFLFVFFHAKTEGSLFSLFNLLLRLNTVEMLGLRDVLECTVLSQSAVFVFTPRHTHTHTLSLHLMP